MSYFELDETCPMVKQPKGLKVKLRPHQLTSICAMKSLETQGSIVIDKPTIDSGLYTTVRSVVRDVNEFTGSTFILETNSAILADKVGAGKTYTIIGLLLNTKIPQAHQRFVLGSNHFSVKMNSIKEAIDVNLIVVPHNLAIQWGEFLDNSKLECLILNTASDFDVFFDIDYVTEKTAHYDELVIYSASRKKKLPAKKGSKTEKPKAVKAKAEVIYEKRTLSKKKIAKVLSSTTAIVLNINRYVLFKKIFRSIQWARVIIDEMDSANIPASFDEFGNFNWFLTATPTAIFYKSCRRYVNKIFGNYNHLLKYFVVKNKDDYVDKSIVLPKPCVFIINTRLQRIVAAIQNLIPHDVLQLINAGNMKEAITKLNCDVDTEENIVKVLTCNIEKDLHNFTKELEYVRGLIPNDLNAHKLRKKNLKASIARCKTKLETIKEKIESINKESCFICADDFDTPTIVDCCKSIFCFKCLLSALNAANNQCPYCRQILDNKKNKYRVIGKDKKAEETKKEEKKKGGKKFCDMDKTDVLEDILTYVSKNDDSPKILIFSDYAQTFEKIIGNIKNAGLKHELLSGIPTHISRVIQDFKQGAVNVLMLDSQHYGSGLNLQDANYLILYHRMTPELEIQVIGRAQRYGRKTPLRVLYLVNENEEKTSVLSKHPYEIENESEMWMVTNPPEDDSNEEVVESDDDESDGSEDESDNETKNNYLLNNPKTITRAKKCKKSQSDEEFDSDDYDYENDNDGVASDESDEELDSETDEEPIVKPKSKSKSKPSTKKCKAKAKPRSIRKYIKSDTEDDATDFEDSE